MVRDLEAARYATDRAFRPYDAADPENRLVAGELEVRWNRALSRVAACETRIAEPDAATPRPTPAPISLSALAEDLQGVWSAPTTDARLKKRNVHTLVQEAIADLDEERAKIVLTLHWAAPTPSTGCRVVGGDSAPARPPTSSTPCVRWR